MEKIEIWLDSMKVALIEENCDKAYELTQNLPFTQDTQSNVEYLNMASELISQAITLLEKNKKDAKEQLEKIRQAKRFFSE